MRKGKLDYKKYKEEHGKGLHVIAVGGLALSRGLTLEGLCVSYIIRNPSAYDTLMQMGRWFGYRPGYEKICRLYLPDFARDYYEFIAEATEELRQEVKLMRALLKTPLQFGLKVRKHPATIKITAANKMDTAKEVTVSLNYGGKHKEGFAVDLNDGVRAHNEEIIRNFLNDLGTKADDYFFWGGVPEVKVRTLLAQFKFPRICSDLYVGKENTSLIIDYIDAVNSSQKWDVCLPMPKKSDFYNDTLLQNKNIRLRRRHSGRIIDKEGGAGILRVTGTKNKVADPDDLKHGLSVEELSLVSRPTDKALIPLRKNPILLVHCFHAKEQKKKELGSFVSLSVCFPCLQGEPPEKKYMANEVYLRLQMSQNEEIDDTDEDLETWDDQ